MKYGVLKYPGGHGEEELFHILKNHFNKDIREIWYREASYPDIGILFIGGGFPCNRLKSGKRCQDESPALKYLGQFIADGGYVIGLGNGFRLLCEMDLLPGELKENISERFICKQVFIKPENQLSPLTAKLERDRIFRIPIATSFGCYEAEEEELVQMRQDGQILFRYCDYEGRITKSVNVTGSVDNIAGVSNAKHNVFGIIPQPERAVSEFRRDADGKKILEALIQELE